MTNAETRHGGGTKTTKLTKIQVRSKRTGKSIRARREYRGPTAAEIAALSAPPAPRKAAPAPEPVVITSQSTTLFLGEPVLTLNGKRAGELTGTRDDRIRIEWPMLATIDDRQARLLDRRGLPLPVPVTVDADDSRTPPRLVLDLRLAPLARGEYSIEVAVAAGTIRERKTLPLKIE